MLPLPSAQRGISGDIGASDIRLALRLLRMCADSFLARQLPQLNRTMNPSHYRPDIDGLRTIAVGGVVLFHAFPAMVTGGFVGVDVFFVISGYLITGILVRERESTGSIDFGEFYARRVRRLLPALLVVIAATLAIGSFLSPAEGERQSLAWSALAALFFLSNLFFALQPGGYFAAPPESYPLLHTWTLAVEEQFYIIWPPLILMAAWIGSRLRLRLRTAIWGVLILLALISLALSVTGTLYRPLWAFYLTPFRAWEFAIGAGLALINREYLAGLRRAASPIGLVSLAMIVGAIVGFNENTPFPGYAAALPTLGTAGVILAGSIFPANPVSRMLALRPLVYVGTISYGWYLWHWPLLAFVHGATLGAPGAATIIAAVVVSFLLSAASFRWIETPIRRQAWRPFIGRGRSLAGGVAIMVGGALLVAITLIGANRELATSSRLKALAATRDYSDGIPSICTHYQSQLSALAPIDECLIGDVQARKLVVLWGDSHAAAMIPMLDNWGKAQGIAVLPRTKGGCRPMLASDAVVRVATSDDLRACSWFRDAVSKQIARLANERDVTVLVAARWPDLDSPETIVGDRSPVGPRMKAALNHFARQADAGNYRLAIALDVPSMPHDTLRCLARRPDADCDGVRAVVDTLRDEASSAIRTFAAARPGIALIDPVPALCDQQRCRSVLDGRAIFKDETHLTYEGSILLGERLTPQLNAALLGVR